MRNIVIVDASSTGKNYINDVVRRNCHPVVLDPCFQEAADPGLFEEREQLHRRYAGIAEYLDEKETYAETLEMIRSFDPLLIIPGGEYGVVLATRLAEDLGLPGNPYASIDKYTSKRSMQEALKAYGIRYIKGETVRNVEEAIQFYRHNELKGCVVKPSRGASSNGVHLCENEEEMITAVEAELNQVNLFGEKTELLIQERIVGTEYIVNTVSCEGKHRLSSVWRYKKRRVEGGGNVYEYAELITRLETGHQRLIQYALNVADAVDYRYGAIHGEYMVDENGPVLIEVNCRPMGGNMSADFLDDVLGHHETDNCLDSYINPSWHEKMISEPYKPFKKAFLHFFIAPEDMEVEMSPVIHLIRHLRSYFSGNIETVLSGRLKRTVDLETKGGVLYMKHEDEMTVRNDIEFLRKVEQEYFNMLFIKDSITMQPMPENPECIGDLIERFQCSRDILVLTNDDSLDVNASIINSEGERNAEGKYNWGILDLNYMENEDIESIIEDFYYLVSKVQRGGHVLIPERSYWHLPCGMESIEILCESIGLILEAPNINSGKNILCTIP